MYSPSFVSHEKMGGQNFTQMTVRKKEREYNLMMFSHESSHL